jgi:hypothetical protein
MAFQVLDVGFVMVAMIPLLYREGKIQKEKGLR